MTDKISKKKRSWNMSRIRSTNTKPELIIRSVLHRMGFRFRVHQRRLPGQPDIVLSKYKTAIFVHGCFWHQHGGCIEASHPKSNTLYWQEKLLTNKQRDRENKRLLQKAGWRVMQFWECEAERNPIRVAVVIEQTLRGSTEGATRYHLPSKRDLLRAAEKKARYDRKR
jgi:DNA mismatch endonuclease (patch repair protein)